MELSAGFLVCNVSKMNVTSKSGHYLSNLPERWMPALYLDVLVLAATHHTGFHNKCNCLLVFYFTRISRKTFLELPFVYNVYLNVYVLTKEIHGSIPNYALFIKLSKQMHFIIINIASKFQNDNIIQYRMVAIKLNVLVLFFNI